MRQFTDAQGRKWTVEVDIAGLQRVRDMVDLDLVDFGPEGLTLFDKLSDPVVLVGTLYTLCCEQARREGVTDEQFGRAMRGDVLDEATDALLEALADFIPSRRAATLRALMAKITRIGEGLIVRAEAALADPALDEAIEKALGGLSGKSPDTSASTPDP